MARAITRALAFSFAIGVASGARLDGARDLDSDDGSVSSGSALGYVEGDTFEEFRLESHIGNEVLDTSLEGDAAVSNNASTDKRLVPFPTKMGNRFGDTKYLGAGSFGEAWLATGLPGTTFEGRRVVVKLLYTKVGRRYVHVTRDMCNKEPLLKREVAGAARECNFAIDLQKAAREMGEEGRYAERLMGCYAHNFKPKTGKMVPIYLVLENCGADDLFKFIGKHAGALTSAHLASITRQIVEGLLYLSLQNPPVIHHDLKPANIVVKQTESGVPTVHLIDFGGMMKATSTSPTKRGTVATMVFAPPEWFKGYAFNMPPSSFDIYAVGNTLAEMAIGSQFSSMYAFKREEPNWNELAQLARTESRSAFVDEFRAAALKMGHSGLAAMEADPDAYNFIVDYWVKMIQHDAKQRPTPEELLQSPWLSKALSPDNPDWRMWEPPAPKPPVVVAPDDDENDGVDSDGEEQGSGTNDVEAGFEGCLHMCDFCAPIPGMKKFRRQAMECGIESENLRDYDIEGSTTGYMKLGPKAGLCDRTYRTVMLGRNRHGKNDHQTYFVWKCGKVSEEEAAKDKAEWNKRKKEIAKEKKKKF